MTHVVVRGSPRHIRPLAKRLRGTHAMSLQAYGFDPRRALHKAFMGSSYVRTALIDERPVAMWGVASPLMGGTAYVWLVMTDEIAHLKRTIVAEARRELRGIMEAYEEVATTVLPADEAAVRFALYLGFHDREDEAVGSRKELARLLVNNPRYRIPVGDSYVIGLGYHGEAR